MKEDLVALKAENKVRNQIGELFNVLLTETNQSLADSAVTLNGLVAMRREMVDLGMDGKEHNPKINELRKSRKVMFKRQEVLVKAQLLNASAYQLGVDRMMAMRNPDLADKLPAKERFLTKWSDRKAEIEKGIAFAKGRIEKIEKLESSREDVRELMTKSIKEFLARLETELEEVEAMLTLVS